MHKFVDISNISNEDLSKEIFFAQNALDGSDLTQDWLNYLLHEENRRGIINT